MVYLPVSFNASGEDDFTIESALTIARLKLGVSAQQALTDAQSVFAHADRRDAERYRRLAMRSYRDLVVGDMQRPLLTLLVGVGVLLLIACANAANLQIGRGASRMPEMTTRSALGASFGRLLQQLITESILVSLLGAVLGGALSYAATEVVRHALWEGVSTIRRVVRSSSCFGLYRRAGRARGGYRIDCAYVEYSPANSRAVQHQERYAEIASSWSLGSASGCANVRPSGDQRPVCAHPEIASKCKAGIRSPRRDHAGPHARAAEPGSGAFARDRNAPAAPIRDAPGRAIGDDANRGSLLELQHGPGRNHGGVRACISPGRLRLLQHGQHELCANERNSPPEGAQLCARR